MNNKDLNKAAEELFLYFLENYPESRKGKYFSAQTNQILAFEEYINTLSSVQIQNRISVLLLQKDIIELRKKINKGIEKYLSDNIKTLAIY